MAPTDGDLHLAEWNSIVADQGQPLAGVTVDVDCESRQVAAGPDSGADEL